MFNFILFQQLYLSYIFFPLKHLFTSTAPHGFACMMNVCLCGMAVCEGRMKMCVLLMNSLCLPLPPSLPLPQRQGIVPLVATAPRSNPSKLVCL